MKIVNTSSLKVKQLEKDKYLTWTPNIYIFFVPKVIFELNENGDEIKVTTVNFLKSVILNLIFSAGVFLIFFYLRENGLIHLNLFVNFLIGVVIFLILT